jgi:sugar/nucleoside kinase (ribokinase family)
MMVRHLWTDRPMPAPADVDLMMIGHFARDRLVVDGQGVTASGGGVYYGSIALRHLGLSVAAVTRLHPDDFPWLGDLKAEGVQVFATPAPATSGIANCYSSADMERRICKPSGFAGPFSPAEIPDLPAQIYAVVPIMAGEVDLALLELLAGRGPVALDVQGFVRVCEGDELVFRPWPDVEKGLSLVTYLKADRAEAELLTGQTDLELAARQLAAYGPREVLLTESWGATVYANGATVRAPFAPRCLDGRTGRGDTCFATYLGRRLQAEPEEAIALAAAVTTLKLERPGPWCGPLADAEEQMRRAMARRTGSE